MRLRIHDCSNCGPASWCTSSQLSGRKDPSTKQQTQFLALHSLPNSNNELAEQEINGNGQDGIHPAMSHTQIRASSLQEPDKENLHLQKLCQQDLEYLALKKTILHGFPSTKADLPMSLKQFWSIKDQLNVDDNFIVYGCRLFIPSSLQPTILTRRHEADRGVSSSQLRARLTLYWPKIDQDIENFVRGCRHCQDHLPSQPKEPIMPKSLPQRPFQQVTVDFTSYAVHHFLILVNYKTDWPDIIGKT